MNNNLNNTLSCFALNFLIISAFGGHIGQSSKTNASKAK